MKELLIFCVITVIFATKLEEKKHECNGVYVRNKFHKLEVLGMGLNRPYQLSYDQHEHRVYFSYNVGKDAEDSFEIGYLERGNQTYRTIKSVENGFATAIDNINGILFTGGNKGIFKKNLKNKTSEFENIISNHDVWDLFIKDNLYFIDYPSQHLYMTMVNEKGKYIVERVEDIHEKVYQFVMDGNDDAYLTDAKGLFRVKAGTTEREWFSGPTVFRSIAVNNKGVAHFGGRNGIYIANKNNNSLEEIASIKNLFGITFDNDDNIIYSNSLEIKKLLPEDCA